MIFEWLRPVYAIDEFPDDDQLWRNTNKGCRNIERRGPRFYQRFSCFALSIHSQEKWCFSRWFGTLQCRGAKKSPKGRFWLIFGLSVIAFTRDTSCQITGFMENEASTSEGDRTLVFIGLPPLSAEFVRNLRVRVRK
jgi:hypothetical protein